MGWQLRTPEEMKAYSRPPGNPIIEKLLAEKMRELNPAEVSEVVLRNAKETLLNQIKTELYTEIDDIASLPQRMGFEDKGGFELFTTPTNAYPQIDKTLAKTFATEATSQLKSKIHIGWQEIPREARVIEADIILLSVGDKYSLLNLNLDENTDLMNRIMSAMEKYYALN